MTGRACVDDLRVDGMFARNARSPCRAGVVRRAGPAFTGRGVTVADWRACRAGVVSLIVDDQPLLTQVRRRRAICCWRTRIEGRGRAARGARGGGSAAGGLTIEDALAAAS